MTFRPSKQPTHPEIMPPSLFPCHSGVTEKKERKKRTKKWGGREVKNQPCVRSVADSDKSFRTHRAGYFIGQGSIDTALARGRGEHRHRKRWGQNSRTHCMGLGATTIFRNASLLLRFFRQIPWSTSWTHVRRICQQHQTILAGSLGGAMFYYTFSRVSGEIHSCSIILRFCDFFSLLGIIPQKQSRGKQAKDRQSGA